MTTPWLLAALVGIALLDGAFAAYRASAGRDGRLRGRGARHLSAGLRGASLTGVIVGLPLGAGIIVAQGNPPVQAALERAAAVIGWVALPYAAIFFLALATWLLTPWRSRFVGMAVILGPLTLVRPLVAVATGVAAAVAAAEWRAAVVALAVTVLPLLTEPLAGRWWYAVHDPRDPRVSRARRSS